MAVSDVERVDRIRRSLLAHLDPARVEPAHHEQLARVLEMLIEDLASPSTVAVSGVRAEARRLLKELRSAARAARRVAADQRALQRHFEAARGILEGSS